MTYEYFIRVFFMIIDSLLILKTKIYKRTFYIYG
jgi:hypothetical protein